MKNLFNEAQITNPAEVKGGTLFLLSWLFGGYRSYGYGGSCGCGGSYGYSSKKSYSKW